MTSQDLTAAVARLLELHDGPFGPRPYAAGWLPTQHGFSRWEDWYDAKRRHEAACQEAWATVRCFAGGVR